MATIRQGEVQIIKKCLYLCQINLSLHETLNLSSWGTNLPSWSHWVGHRKFGQPKWALLGGQMVTVAVTKYSVFVSKKVGKYEAFIKYTHWFFLLFWKFTSLEKIIVECTTIILFQLSKLYWVMIFIVNIFT